MGLFHEFCYWINQNIQQPLIMAETKRLEDGKSSSASEKDTNIQEPWYWDPSVNAKDKAEYMKSGIIRSMPLMAVDPKYHDLAELETQTKLWAFPKKKHPWHDAPAKVKVKTEKGICHLNIEYTLGWPPLGVSEMLTNPRNIYFFHSFEGKDFRQRLENKSTKVLKKDGPRQITEVHKFLRWKLFSWFGSIPIHIIIDENHQNLTANYKKEKMKYMKVFEGSWKIEPLYVDQERLCKSRSQISEKEYKKCSHGQGRIGSKVTMELIFQPSCLLNLPPVSWLVREITIKTTKVLLEDLRKHVNDILLKLIRFLYKNIEY
ncbi:hypothetical protein AALP_AA1G256800 [Arabis alpina]|uniref:DUF220 domain-containing protein n=1 Tax=Arabis alpina TaxID=50452 RepID=A0A087HQN8_ARAAL|nr:hypothetical protein AALP_AA1G256800 [Arabis alpina]